MRTLLRSHSVDQGAFAAADFFSHIGGKAVVPDLIEATAAPTAIVATEAFGALLRILDVKDLPQVRPLFDQIYNAKPERDERPNDRLERLMFVMEEGKGLRGAILIDLLDHPAWEVRHEMLMGLERHPIVSAHPKINAMANDDPSKVVRRSALLALHKIYPKRSSDRLVAYAKSPDPLDRACAAKAIRHDHTLEVEEAVMTLVNDKDATVRVEVAISLWSSLRPDAESTLQRLAKDPDSKVRAAATIRPERD
jgi:HEAT repeat protein